MSKDMYKNLCNRIIDDRQNVATTKCSSVNEKINKMWLMHAVEYDSATEKQEVLTRTTAWINL